MSLTLRVFCKKSDIAELWVIQMLTIQEFCKAKFLLQPSTALLDGNLSIFNFFNLMGLQSNVLHLVSSVSFSVLGSCHLSVDLLFDCSHCLT